MKIVATIILGFAVLIATLFFLSCSICAVSSGIPSQSRAIAVVFALVSLAVMIGGMSLIAGLYKAKKSSE